MYLTLIRTFYGAGARTGALNVEGKLAKALEKQDGVLVVRASERDKVLDEISARAARYKTFDPETFEELQTLRKKVKTVFDSGLSPSDDLLDQLYFLNNDTKVMVDKLTASYDQIVTPSDFNSIAKIMSSHLADQVPITKDFTKFLGTLASDYLENAKPSNADFDWKSILKTQLVGTRKKGFAFGNNESIAKGSLGRTASEILGIKANEALSEKVLKRFGFWDPNGTLANIVLGANSPKARRTGAKYLKTNLDSVGGFELFTANKLPKAWTNVPSVNFDGKVIEQNFTQVYETRLNYKDKDGNWVKNILQIPEKTSATWWEQVINKKGKINDVADLSKARTAFGVNSNHSNDAVIVKKFHLWGKENNIATSTIHDAFFTNIADITKARKGVREMYADTLNTNVIKATLDEMKARGLPDEIYQKKLNEAIELGLIPVIGKTKIKGRPMTAADLLTSKDILEGAENDPYGEDKNWYGVN